MRYISTRGETPPMAFQDAVITGLAPDGGLLLPEHIPDLRDRLGDWRGLGFVELACELMGCFIDDIPTADLERIVRDAYANFEHPEIAPLVDVGDLQVLELFHGPTLAFKDVALQFLGELFDYTLARRGGRLNIVAATSGDTGSAAIAGVAGKSNIDIAVMFPKGRVSQLQQLQMTTVSAANVHCLAVQGSFDDCQSLMKQAFADQALKSDYQLGAVNSVNWARVLAQIVYYAYAALRSDRGDGVNISVPTGNFGNIFAGFVAKKMGLPINRLILGTNDNDILSTFFNTGAYRRGSVHHTISPSMDIQIASNFERYLYYALGESGSRVQEFMAEFGRTGEASLPAEQLSSDTMSARAIDTPTTLTTIEQVFRETGYVLDPHTAVGVAAAQQLAPGGPTICIATAHPAKFPESIADVVGEANLHHSVLDRLRELPERYSELAATPGALRGFIESTFNRS